MKEETMRQIMITYFKVNGVEAIPQKGAGPDLHLKDKGVVEVKGSKYDFDRMLRQLVDYAKKHTNVGLALPFDGLNLEQAEKLRCLSHMIEESGSNVRLYFVAPVSKESNAYYVKNCKIVAEIGTMMSASPGSLGFDFKDPKSTIDKAVENLAKYSPQESSLQFICKSAAWDHMISKIQL